MKKTDDRKAPHRDQEYLGNGKHSWEPVDGATAHTGATTTRMRVPSGWLYRNYYFQRPMMVFVPVLV